MWFYNIWRDFSRVPIGLEDVSKFSDLFDLLKEKNPEIWTIANLEKLAGRNLVRVFTEAEEVRDSLRSKQPDDSFLPPEPADEDKPEETPGTGSSAAELTARFLLYLVTLLIIYM